MISLRNILIYEKNNVNVDFDEIIQITLSRIEVFILEFDGVEDVGTLDPYDEHSKCG